MMSGINMFSAFIFPDILLYILDMIGIIACASAGTLLAQHKGFDIAGCILVSMVNAIGGGTLRDMALPPLFYKYFLIFLIKSIRCLSYLMLLDWQPSASSALM